MCNSMDVGGSYPPHDSLTNTNSKMGMDKSFRTQDLRQGRSREGRVLKVNRVDADTIERFIVDLKNHRIYKLGDHLVHSSALGYYIIKPDPKGNGMKTMFLAHRAKGGLVADERLDIILIGNKTITLRNQQDQF